MFLKLTLKSAAVTALLVSGCNPANNAQQDDSSSVMGVISGVDASDKGKITNRTYWLECDDGTKVQGSLLDDGASSKVQFTNAALANPEGKRCRVKVKGSDNANYTFYAKVSGAVERGTYFISTNAAITNRQLTASMYRVYSEQVAGATFTAQVFLQFPNDVASTNLANARLSLVCSNGTVTDSTNNVAGQGGVAAVALWAGLSAAKYSGVTCTDVDVVSDGGEWRLTVGQSFTFGTPAANTTGQTKDGKDGSLRRYVLGKIGVAGAQDVEVNTTFVGTCTDFEQNTTAQQCKSTGTSAD